VEGFGVSGGSDEEGGSGVEDGGAALESEALATDGYGESTLPETVPVDVREGDEGGGVELGLVKTSESDLAVVETVGDAGDLVGSDSCAD